MIIRLHLTFGFGFWPGRSLLVLLFWQLFVGVVVVDDDQIRRVSLW